MLLSRQDFAPNFLLVIRLIFRWHSPEKAALTADVFGKQLYREHLSSFYLLHIFLVGLFWVCLLCHGGVQQCLFSLSEPGRGPPGWRASPPCCTIHVCSDVQRALTKPRAGMLPRPDTTPVPGDTEGRGPASPVSKLAPATVGS